MSRETRREEGRALISRRRLDALLLRRPANFAWYTGGADNRVDHADPLGVAAVLLTDEAEYVVADNIEAPRMRAEQTPDMEVAEYPWHAGPEALLEELIGGGRVGADSPAGFGSDLDGELAALRYVLDDEAVGDYKLLGADAATAISEVASALSPDTDELEAAAELAASCRRRGMFAPVLVAASEDRLRRYRHPLPRGGRLGRRAMLVVCAERGGLYANLTRMVSFEEPDPETARRQRACDEILRRMREEATRPGTTLAEAFAACQAFYTEAGFPEGWRDHHQGGITGYASREVVASPATRVEIKANQAFAWNPSLPGAKAEETFVLRPGGPKVLTAV